MALKNGIKMAYIIEQMALLSNMQMATNIGIKMANVIE
jgi:hypothetical protein